MINGIELKVGQVWLTRDKRRCVITYKNYYGPYDEYPWCGDIDGETFTYTGEGKFYTSPQESDLIQLLEVVPEKSSVNSVNKTGNTFVTAVAPNIDIPTEVTLVFTLDQIKEAFDKSSLDEFVYDSIKDSLLEEHNEYLKYLELKRKYENV